jgi:hypothetical protein
MAEVVIDLPTGQPEEVEVVRHETEQRTRWKLRDISLDPETRAITVRFFDTVSGEVVHKTRMLSVQTDPETGAESGFWAENAAEIGAFVNMVLQAFGITEVK